MSEALELILLGVLQGLTEFLPVSSSGHLALGQALLGLKEDNLLRSVTLHGGTLLATVLYFRHRLSKLTVGIFAAARSKSEFWRDQTVQDVSVIVLTAIPTGIIGLTLKHQVEQWTTEVAVVGVGFLFTAALLVSTRYAPVSKTAGVGLAAALLLGVMQGLAVLPGISRSGATIATLLWLGISATRAFELSMLISLPPVLGAFLLESAEAVQSGSFGVELLLGAAVSFGVGLLALHWLKGLVTQGRLSWFAWYVLPLSVVTLVWSSTEVITGPK